MPRTNTIRFKPFVHGKTTELNPIETSQAEPIQTMGVEEFRTLILPKVAHRHHQEQAEIYLILLYWLGRRPVELIDLAEHQIQRIGQALKLSISSAKHGRDAILYLPTSNPDFKRVSAYWQKLAPRQYFFWAFRGAARVKTVSFVHNKKTGERTTKTYGDRAKKISYWVKKWTGLPPYFFRHNRYTLMAQAGASVWDIQYAKGSRTTKSVEPYISYSKPERLGKYFK